MDLECMFRCKAVSSVAASRRRHRRLRLDETSKSLPTFRPLPTLRCPHRFDHRSTDIFFYTFNPCLFRPPSFPLLCGITFPPINVSLLSSCKAVAMESCDIVAKMYRQFSCPAVTLVLSKYTSLVNSSNYGSFAYFSLAISRINNMVEIHHTLNHVQALCSSQGIIRIKDKLLYPPPPPQFLPRNFVCTQH